MKNDIKEISMIGGILVALSIGAGFGSGQELFQFFTSYGLLGFLGGLLSFSVLLYGCEAIVTAGWNCRDCSHTSVFTYFCGTFLGRIYNFLIPIALYSGFVIMISGAGGLFVEFFHLPNEIGRILVVLVTILSLFIDFSSITKVISKSGQIVAVILILISLITIFRYGGNLFQNHNSLKDLPIIKSGDSFYSAGILYGTLIIMGSAQFMFELGKKLSSSNNIFKGVLFGASLLIGTAMLVHLSMLFHLHEVYQLKIITLYFAKNISLYLGWVVAILLLLVMISSSITNFWVISDTISKVIPSSYPKRFFYIFMSILAVIGFFISAIPFRYLINFIQP
ncbi:MAG: hypothetical protein ACRCV0_07510, partial [Brevinema sp.]